MSLRFRQYLPSDRAACTGIFLSNVPRFFRDNELDEFLQFVDSSDCPYFVVQVDGTVAGCGGYGVDEDCDPVRADLCWGMVQAEFHGNHLGEFLLLGRLNEIVTKTNAAAVRLGTSQHTEGFFQRYGFAVQSVKPDGIAEGLDDVEMRMELTEELKRAVRLRWQKIHHSHDCD